MKMQKDKSPESIGYGSTAPTNHHHMNANPQNNIKIEEEETKIIFIDPFNTQGNAYGRGN